MDSIKTVNMPDVRAIQSNSVRSIDPEEQFLLSKVDDAIRKIQDAIKNLTQKIDNFLAALKCFLISPSSTTALDQLKMNHAEVNKLQQETTILGFALNELLGLKQQLSKGESIQEGVSDIENEVNNLLNKVKQLTANSEQTIPSAT